MVRVVTFVDAVDVGIVVGIVVVVVVDVEVVFCIHSVKISFILCKVRLDNNKSVDNLHVLQIISVSFRVSNNLGKFYLYACQYACLQVYSSSGGTGHLGCIGIKTYHLPIAITEHTEQMDILWKDCI